MPPGQWSVGIAVLLRLFRYWLRNLSGADTQSNHGKYGIQLCRRVSCLFIGNGHGSRRLSAILGTQENSGSLATRFTAVIGHHFHLLPGRYLRAVGGG